MISATKTQKEGKGMENDGVIGEVCAFSQGRQGRPCGRGGVWVETQIRIPSLGNEGPSTEALGLGSVWGLVEMRPRGAESQGEAHRQVRPALKQTKQNRIEKKHHRAPGVIQWGLSGDISVADIYM